jgi:hypothetical protein
MAETRNSALWNFATGSPAAFAKHIHLRQKKAADKRAMAALRQKIKKTSRQLHQQQEEEIQQRGV